MPKISAPTVAEHRAAQRAALLDATRELLLETGLAGVTPRAVAERAGLARSSFYQYFGTRDDALAAVAIESFASWSAEIEAALAAAPAEDHLHVYVAATMRMTADGKHGIAAMLQQAEIAPSKLDDIMALHDELLRPLGVILAERGIRHLELNASLVQGLLSTGVRLVTHGADPSAVTEGIVRLLDEGVPGDARI